MRARRSSRPDRDSVLGARRTLVAVLAAASVLTLAGVATSQRAQRAAPASEVAGARYRLDAGAAKAEGARMLTPATRRAGLRFDSSVAQGDRAAVVAAVAAARPEARALVDLVDGLVDVRVGPVGGHAVGITEVDEPGYRVDLDLGLVSSRYGERGIQRVVLHELGHVVDHALVPDTLAAGLDADIPTGLGCDEGTMGACADREERFAETFAKWALGDIGVNLDIGYKVPPPALALSVWGAPLAALAG
jgi:hypothetical protein